MYYEIYELIANYIFNNQLTSHAELVCTLVSTCVCLGYISIPFVLVYWFITKMVSR